MTHGIQSAANGSDLLLDTDPRAHLVPRLLESSRLQIFYGDLHNHTGYSDGTGRPEDALRQMRERGLHFAAITDHGEFLERATTVADTNKWVRIAEQVAAIASDEFFAIRGFEWSSPNQGHSNVWWSANYTGYHATGDESMAEYYRWLRAAEPVPGAKLFAGFNHPGREHVCFDGCSFVPSLDDRIVTLECFNREDDYGEVYFRALDRGWHVGAIGVSDHHGSDWGSPRLPRAGLLARALTLEGIQDALENRRVFATRSPSLALLMAGNGTMMGSRLRLGKNEPLEIGIWCDDPRADDAWTRLELWTNGATLLEARETHGIQQLQWRAMVTPPPGVETWYVVRVQRGGIPVAYTSPIWVTART
jgi:hypothetical protein